VATAAVFGTALLARLLYLAIAGYYYNSDTEQYYRIAENLLQHQSYSLAEVAPYFPTIRRPPLYPIFIAATGIPSMGAMSVIHAVLSAITAVMLLVLARMALPMKYAIGAAAFYALHPGAIWMSSCILGETLYGALLVAAVLLLCLGAQSQRLRWAAFGGLILGLAALNRPIALLLPVAFWATFRWLMPVARRTALSATMLGAAMLIVAPWAARCTLVSQSFVLVQGCLPVNVYMAARTDWDPANESHVWQELRFGTECGAHLAKNLGADLTPQEQVAADRICARDALALIKSNFTGWVKSRFVRVPHLLINSFDNFTHLRDGSWGVVLRDRDFVAIGLKTFMLVTFALLPVVLMGAAIPKVRSNQVIALCFATCAYTVLAHLVTWIEIRFWMPAVPFQALTATAGLQQVWESARKRNRRPAELASA
jgi:hypothetical protein